MSVCFELNQESENALAIKIKDQIFDKLKNCNGEEELKQTLINILNENDAVLDIEKIQNGDEVSRLLDNFLACSVEQTPDNLEENKIQLGNLLQNAVDLVCNPPAFTIPYPFPVIDLSNNFTEKLLLALLRLAIKIILSIIKKLLSLIIDFCSNNGLSDFNKFGSENIQNMLAQSIGDELSQSFVADVFSLFGVDENGHSTVVITTGEEVPCDDVTPSTVAKGISDFLDDLSIMATPVELCSLLNNKAKDNTFVVVEELLEFEYPEIRKRLNNRAKIASLFKVLGTKTDPSICQIIEDNAEKIIAAPELCFTSDVNQVRDSLLKEKNLTDQQIKDILDKERNKVKKDIAKLAELANFIKTDPNKILGDTPEIFCKGSKAGLVTVDDMPSLKEAVSDTVDSTFNTFAMVFNLNASSFVNNILDTKKTENTTDPIIKKFIDSSTIDSNGEVVILENSLNTKFMQKVSQGQFTLCDQNGSTDKENLLKYYKDIKINDRKIVNNNVIDVQALSSTTNYDSFDGGEDGKVFIKNYIYEAKTTPDVINVCNNVANYVELDYEKMSISINIPNKYKDIRNPNAVSDFSSLPSTQKLTIYTISGSSQ